MAIVTNKEETKTITKEELENLREIQLQTKNIIIELGEIQVMKFQLENRENNSKELFNKLIKQEEIFTKSLLEKYGTIEINPETGEINKDV